MGIGNDIKPKKVYRYKQPHHSVPFSLRNKKEDEEDKHDFKPKSSDAESHNTKSNEELEDDFFHDYNKVAPKKEKKEGNSGGFLFQNLNAKNITWIFIITLIVIVIYQNFDSIKGIFVTKDGGSSNSNSNDEYYEGTATNKNSNTASTNSNVNTNTNLNANTNSTVSATIDKTAIKLKVLNGNGVAGSADKVTTTLTTVGFTPAKSGNASKFTYTDSIIYYKTGEEESANLVKAALPTLATTLELSDTIVGTYDVIVVVGKQ